VPHIICDFRERFTNHAQLSPLRPPRPEEPPMLEHECLVAFHFAHPRSRIRHPPPQACPTYSAHLLPGSISLETKPYIHILFRAEFAESWMTQLVSDIPKTPVDWLVERGFGNMEYFDVKVGVATAGMDRRA
jgi:hypothetical protein